MDKEQAINILQDYTDLMAIQRQLLNYCTLDEDERVHRGTIHRLIAKDLNLTINPRFYSLVHQVITRLNIRKIKVQGISHYKGLSLRKHV